MKRKFDYLEADNDDHGEQVSFEFPKDGHSSSGSSFAKLERERERNREHAKRTRKRKKDALEGMKTRLVELHEEMTRLEQLLEEKNTINILLHLNRNASQPVVDQSTEGKQEDESAPVVEKTDAQAQNILALYRGNIVDQLRQRVRIEATAWEHHPAFHLARPFHEKMKEDDKNGQAISADCLLALAATPIQVLLDHCNDNESDGNGRAAASAQYADAKRERNRLHAQLTRQRRKLFSLHMAQTIHYLERHVTTLRGQLHGVVEVNITSSSQKSTFDTSSVSAQDSSTDTLSGRGTGNCSAMDDTASAYSSSPLMTASSTSSWGEVGTAAGVSRNSLLSLLAMGRLGAPNNSTFSSSSV